MDTKSKEYLFAQDIVFCIMHHYQEKRKLIQTCPKSKTRPSLLTPELESKIVTLLFGNRKQINDLFRSKHLTKPFDTNNLINYLEELTVKFLSHLYTKSSGHTLMFRQTCTFLAEFFRYVLNVAAFAVLFLRGGYFHGSNLAISRIYVTIQQLQKLGFFKNNIWEELSNWSIEQRTNTRNLKKSIGEIEFYFSCAEMAAIENFRHSFQQPGILLSAALNYFDIRRIVSQKNELSIIETELNLEYAKHNYETQGQYEYLAINIDNIFVRMDNLLNMIMDNIESDLF